MYRINNIILHMNEFYNVKFIYNCIYVIKQLDIYVKINVTSSL